jgi:hypothetical protein
MAIASIKIVRKQSGGSIASESSIKRLRAYRLCQNVDDTWMSKSE